MKTEDFSEFGEYGRSPRFAPGAGIILAVIGGLILWAIVLRVANAQPAPSSTPEVRALYTRLSNEVSANVQCGAMVIGLQDQVGRLTTELSKTEAEAKRLADKYEPKKEEPKKP